MKAVLVFLSIFFVTNISIASEFLCTHPQACNLVSESLLDSDKHVFKLAIDKELDPHHHELSPLEIKSLITAEYLIIAPEELQPWVKTILKKRSKNTLIISLSDEVKNLQNTHQLSHFWLYPEQLCFNKKFIRTQLKKYKFKVNNHKCNKDYLNNMSNTLKDLNSKSYVLSHDALSGLFSKFKINHIALKGSHHHDSIDSKKMKILQKFKKKYPTLTWIKESNVKIPHNIINKKRTTDSIIELDITGKLGTKSEQVLLDLITKLTKEI